MRRPDRGTLRAAGFVILIVAVFLTVNTQVAYAADGASGGTDLMAPLNVDSSEGVPIEGYELSSQSGSVLSFKSNAYVFVMSGLFTFVRVLVGLACWALEFAFRLPVLHLLADPAQKMSDAYNHAVVDTLGLKGLLLAWAFVFGLILFVRGKVGKGLGEIVLTLLIAAFAASAFVRPDYLLASNGPIAQTEQAAAEISQQSVNSHDWGGKIATEGPCDRMAGNSERSCAAHEASRPVSAADVTRPIQDALTNALVVKPFMLLEYGRILDPGKKPDVRAYAVHLKWVTGGYKPNANGKAKDDNAACRLIHGPGKKYCNDPGAQADVPDELPALTPGGSLLDAASPVLTKDDQQFAAFLKDLKKTGPVGKAAAEYAQEPTGWRTAGAVMIAIAALLICGMALSSATVLLGTQAADAAAAAVGGITLVWGMLPGPNRQAVWKWLALFAVSVATMFGTCLFIPFFGIAIDTVFTNGPDLVAERLLLLDVLAIVGLAGQRWLLRGISGFGQRIATRMQFSKVGGTHLGGDSGVGAALAMSGTGGGGGFGLARGMGLAGGGGGSSGLGTRQRIMRSLGAMADGTGMPVDPQRVLADAGAEATRGLAPLALGATGARMVVRGAYGLLVGRRPDTETLDKMRRPVADDDATTPRPYSQGRPRPGGGGHDTGKPDNLVRVDRTTGEVFEDEHGAQPEQERTPLGIRAHNRLVRLRGYRILNRGARFGYGATIGLPGNLRRTRSKYTKDTLQQLHLWGGRLREDGQEWQRVGRGAASASRATAKGATRVGRRIDVAARVHGPAAAAHARQAARATGTAAAFAFGGVGQPKSRPAQTTSARGDDPAADARRRILDALMQAQRSQMNPPPTWGGTGSGGDES
ncbi:hypothetical protein [Streptomyces sp. NBC_01500]|uniref:hypothetical protein n=1 Tax=Streptomyces sp. NBC_01500 TaxID=2903886 RepID=UPI002259CF69|nr:hypothetical protein [Streptomyces sp. NBC_01500]MCX4554226.1 hypothetical protein [Streptomyces sp. NBC_01500]